MGQSRGFYQNMEKSMSATKELIKEVCFVVQVFNKCYFDLFQQLTGAMKDARLKSEADRRKVVERGRKIYKLYLNL